MAEAFVNHQLVVNSDLITQCIAGKRASQERLYRMFSPKMFAICLRYANDKSSAEDILQEGFIKVFNNLDKYQGKGSFEGWVRRVFVNTAIEHYRKAVQHERHTEIDSAYELYDKSETGVGRLAAKDLMNMVQQLPMGYRTVFNLYALEGFSHKEISEKLGISEGTSKSQLARARATLQKMLKSLG